MQICCMHCIPLDRIKLDHVVHFWIRLVLGVTHMGKVRVSGGQSWRGDMRSALASLWQSFLSSAFEVWKFHDHSKGGRSLKLANVIFCSYDILLPEALDDAVDKRGMPGLNRRVATQFLCFSPSFWHLSALQPDSWTWRVWICLQSVSADQCESF